MTAIQTYIDYTLLRPELMAEGLRKLCETAISHQFHAVCIPPACVADALTYLEESGVKVCSVVGFPHGLQHTHIKLSETEYMIALGVDELDMVINMFDVKSKDWENVEREIEQFQEICKEALIVGKIVVESCHLDVEEIKTICDICNKIRVDFVKTSTGFAEKGTELDKVRLMRSLLHPDICIKASGGISDYTTAKSFIAAGATRIGTSSIILEP